MFWQIATGGTVSSIVIVAVQVETLPLLSVTVKVEVFAPTFAHVNAVGVADKLAMPQASVLPPSMSDAVMLALPDPSS